MTRLLTIPCVLLCLVGCVISQNKQTTPRASVYDNMAPGGGESTTTEPGKGGDDLGLWQQSAFRDKLTTSYLSESEIEPGVTEPEREQLAVIFDLIASDNMDEAAVLIKENQTDARSAVFDFTLANIHFQKNELDDAAVNYAVAVRKFPKFRRAWKNMGLIYVRQNKFKGAIEALTKVIELGGGDGLTYGLLGFAYASPAVNDHLSAESAFRQAILLDPGTLDWQLGLARSLFRQERFADTASLCAKLLRDKPENTDLWILQASAYLGMKEPMRAAQNYEIVDRLGKSTPAGLQMLADIYVNEGLFDLGVDASKRAMKLDSAGSPERAIRAAKVIAAQGDRRAARDLIVAIESSYAERLDVTQRKDLLKIRARLALADGDADAEAAVLAEIVKIDPLDGEALIQLGQYYGRTGEPDKAVFHYERAAGIEQFEADAKVRHAQLLVTQGKYREAIPLLKSAQQAKPRDTVQDYLEQVERIAGR